MEVKKAIVANISEIQQDAAVKDLEAFKKGQKKIISEIKKMNKDVEKERKKVAKVLKYIAGDGKDDDSQVAIAKIEGAETLALAKELGMNLVDVAQATQDKITDIREKSITEIIESYTPPSFGNELADSIMSAVSAMDSLNTVYEEHAKKTVKIQALRDRADATEDLKERERLMGKVADGEATLIKEQLSGYRELFSTTKTMFKENSKARKAMNTMEMAFAAAEIGMNLQKSISNAVVAITTQGSGDPYTAFFRVAAMAASMASILSQIGGSVSGGSGSDTPRKAAPAIGTVFGDKDAVSESILNSEELLDSYHAEDYAELTGIHREVRDLNNNITGIVRSLIRGDGGGWTAEAMGINEDYQEGGVASAITKSMDVVQSLMDPLSGWVDDLLGGIVSKAADWIFGGGKKVTIKGVGLTQARDEEGEVAAPVSIKDIQEGQLIDIVKYVDKKIKKSGMFGTSSSERETDYEDVGSEIDIMFTKIFKNLGNSFMEIADIFNMDAKLIEDYVIDIGKIDLQNLETGDEINEALQAGLANISDTAATELFGDLVGRYQDIGEGVFETAVRVASQQVIVLESLKKMDGAFDDLGLTERSIEFTQGLIEMSGGMDSFMQSVETYYSKFFSDAERLEDLKRNFSAQFADLGIAMPGSRVDFRSLGDKAMNTQNEEAISTFLRLVPLADEYYTLLEKEESKRAANAKKFGEEISDNAAAILNFLAPFEKMTKQADMSDVGKAYDNLTEKYEKANLQLIALGGATSDNIQILTDAQGIEMDTLKASVIDPLKEMVGVAEDAEGWEKKLFEAKWDTIKADMELLDVWDEVLFNKAKQIDMEKELGQASMNTVEIINQAVGKLNASTAEADKDLKRLLVGGTDASFALTELIDFATAVGDTTNISAEDIAKALGLLDDAYSTAIQGAISAAQDMSNAFYDAIDAQESLTKTIEDTIFNLKYSEINQALTSTKFETAKGDYTALKEAAMGGSSEDITKYLDFIDTYLNLARETEKSSEAYQTEYDRVMRDLGEGGLLGYTSGEDFLAKEEAKNIAEINRKTGDLSPSAQTFLINATTKIKRDFQPYFDASNDVLVDLETTLGLLIDAIDDLAALSFIPSASGGKDLGDRPKPAPYVPKDLGDRPRPTAPGAMSAGAILQAALTQTQGNFASNMKDANVTADEIIRAVQGGGYADISEEDIREYLATGGFRNGGWSDGPDSGYLVGLHGKEYVMNESEYKEIANMVSRAMNYSQGSPRESSGSSEETKELIKEQNRLLEDQNEMMLSLLEKEQTVMVDGEVLGSIVDKRTQRTFEQYDRGAQSL
ncbi:hypothetical protein KAR91_64870 [Candidatus Pacearchaeota archaeon]|nr:hypothetical protein [Candidatus Pacearchaeota archaeon]